MIDDRANLLARENGLDKNAAAAQLEILPSCSFVPFVVNSLLRSRIQRRRRILRQLLSRAVGALDFQFAEQD